MWSETVFIFIFPQYLVFLLKNMQLCIYCIYLYLYFGNILYFQFLLIKKSLKTSSFVINGAETTEIAYLGDVGIFYGKSIFWMSAHY